MIRLIFFIDCRVKWFYSVLSICILSANLSGAQILENADEAFKLSAASQKPVLLIFSGSDWCAPCIQFQKRILSDEQFEHYASDHFIMLKVDFPQRRKLERELLTQNEALAEKYNPKGQFPHILLLRPDQTVLSLLSYRNQQPQEFISQLSVHFSE